MFKKMAWGELTQSKQELLIRNDRIYDDYPSDYKAYYMKKILRRG